MHYKAVINMCGNTVCKWLHSGDITENEMDSKSNDNGSVLI